MKHIIVLILSLLTCSLLLGVDEQEQPVKQPRLTFMEFGSDMCVSCRGMRAVTEEIDRKYDGLVKVVFIDVMVDDQLAKEYRVEQIPTQVYIGTDNREFFRHEDMATVEDISKIIDEYLKASAEK